MSLVHMLQENLVALAVEVFSGTKFLFMPMFGVRSLHACASLLCTRVQSEQVGARFRSFQTSAQLIFCAVRKVIRSSAVIKCAVDTGMTELLC